MTLSDIHSSFSASDGLVDPGVYHALASQHHTLKNEHAALQHEVVSLQKRIAWFEQQIFGQKSERRIELDHRQLSLGEQLGAIPETVPPKTQTILAHEREISRKKPLDGAVNDSGLRFGPQVPVEEIRLTPPGIEGLAADAYEIIDEKVSHKLAQQASTYVVIKYIMPVIKLKATAEIVSTPAPAAVLEKSYADVSFLAGMMIDKFAYHQPLYRQHQKLERNGIVLARGTLTTSVERAIALFEPIYDSQFESVLASLVLAMDETPTKAGREQPGKMKIGYFWPIFGDRNEIVFPFVNNRRHENVVALLKGYKGILLTDGYAAYERYAARQKKSGDEDSGIRHAHCWVHLRRMFLKDEGKHPNEVAYALEHFRRLYQIEGSICEESLSGDAKRAYRQAHSGPIVQAFFAWLLHQQQHRALLPSDDFTKALNFALKHRASFELFLSEPDLALDTNHVERALRVIPMGRKNWNFCWTELGAKQVGIIQSLIVTCHMHDINAYDYLVDVLQRVSQHPASRVAELTPRLWKERFSGNPLRSPLDVARSART